MTRVLVVEDSPTQAQQFVCILEDDGFEAESVPDAQACLELLARAHFDLVLSDLFLHATDGFDLCRQIKANPSFSNIPVVLVTKWADPINVLRGVEAGADGFITKGREPEEIVRRLRQVLVRPARPISDIEPRATVAYMNEEFNVSAPREQLLEVLLLAFEDQVQSVRRQAQELEVQVRERTQELEARKRAEEAIVKYNERLKILHQIDSALIAGEEPAAIAATALPLLRELLGTRRVVVNLFNLAANEVEWLAAAGPRRVHVGPGVRYTMDFMGEVEALRRGELQFIDVAKLPAGPEVEALVASGVHSYAVVPMIAREELIGALSFGGQSAAFSPEQLSIARETAAQFAIAITQARLHERVRRQAQELEVRVRERTQELEMAHAELQTTNNELVALTAELKAANNELEAFSYSVSHDLRAPLRAIDGFSRIVLEDYASQLPADANSLLQDVRTNTLQMGRLVDDLLAFSRLSRQPVKGQTVDNGQLVHQCLDELRRACEGRHVDIRVGDLDTCHADPALLKQVWINLLANAVKYTGKRDSAVIEVACKNNDGRNIYYVKDNGVGFDMRYAHKLFGVFQRLHRAEDYEGTGVGLAIVQRIIHRHGGQIWAEAQVDQGATFFFTLDPRKHLDRQT
ncbi:MAG TPA: ATP-binding protein [Gemmataceae bacterium]|nr:ATP-binding protein [Gemmataceae bacterium]